MMAQPGRSPIKRNMLLYIDHGRAGRFGLILHVERDTVHLHTETGRDLRYSRPAAEQCPVLGWLVLGRNYGSQVSGKRWRRMQLVRNAQVLATVDVTTREGPDETEEIRAAMIRRKGLPAIAERIAERIRYAAQEATTA